MLHSTKLKAVAMRINLLLLKMVLESIVILIVFPFFFFFYCGKWKKKKYFSDCKPPQAFSLYGVVCMDVENNNNSIKVKGEK